MPATSNPTAENQAEAARIVDEAWREYQRSPYVQARLGKVLAELPHISPAESQRRSAVGQALLKRVNTLNLEGLPHDLALTLRLVRFKAQTWAREADWYWRVVDPLAIGSQFGLFLPTAYCGGLLLAFLNQQLSSFPLNEPEDFDRYLQLLVDYQRLIDQFTERTLGQAERGMRMPRPQVMQARVLVNRLKVAAIEALKVSPSRAARASSATFVKRVEEQIEGLIEPAFDALSGVFSDDYLARAPEVVGMGQYPAGEAVYAELVKLQTTLDLTPQQVHQRGVERMAQIGESLRAVRESLGFSGDPAAFLLRLNQDPRWRENTVEGVARVFQRYIDRFKPHLAETFGAAPRATYRVAPLAESLQGSMTFGYFDAPRADRAEGIYYFNAANLTQQALFRVAALTYHELVPGHHLHLATQLEHKGRHPFRTYNSVTAFNEGWAEYAGVFAGELGLYEEPEERYGRLLFDAFLTSRLVVDTGMNVLGWSLERARTYMRERAGMDDEEIKTESLRYSCDIPAHALAYKLGDQHFFALRERVRNALGERFNLKDFHAMILGPGTLPLGDVQWHVEREIDRRRAEAQSSCANQHLHPYEPSGWAG